MELRHPEQDLAELGGHLGVVGHGVLLQGVHHLHTVEYRAAAHTQRERERKRERESEIERETRSGFQSSQ